MNITELTVKLKKFFSARKLTDIARENDFIIRERKITSVGFLKTMLIAGAKDNDSSLEYITSLFDDDGISLTKQSLSQKINSKGVVFMRDIFNNLCKEFICEKFLDKDCKFTDVTILDSSEIKLNKKLVEFKNKQNGPRCKIQTICGLLSNRLNCEITKANKNDQSYINYLDHIRKDNLIVFDLGYFCLENFRKIIKKEAYFVSRYLRGTVIMDVESKEIDIRSLLKNSNGDIDIKVLIGRESKLECRFIAKKLTGEALESRLEKISRDSKRAGKKSRNKEEIDFWSIYITNLEEETMSDIHNLYALRWQIELLFKGLKSKLSMGYIKDTNSDKAMIMLYSKLIILMVGMILIRCINDVEISLYKAIDYYKERIKVVCKNLITGNVKKTAEFMLKMKNSVQKSKNKNRASSLEKSPLRIVFSSA